MRPGPSTAAAILFAISTVGCYAPTATGGVESAQSSSDVACDIHGCISISKFSQSISSLLANNVVGYISQVGSLPPVFAGWARTASDAPSWSPGGIAMLPDLPINIASVSKILTTIAVLQSLARHGISIDSSISPYIWPGWTHGQNIDTITFRDLLTHRSGFRNGCGGSNTTYAVLKQQIADGVALSDKQTASYNNCNFAVFRELLPFMEGQVYNPFFSGPADRWSANFYVNYMNQHVFAPVGIPARTCAPPPNTYWNILSYPNPAGNAHGTDWGDWTLACGGGGWNLSEGDLARIINDVATGSTLLTAAERDQMFTANLGWDNSVRGDCPSPNVCKNGNLNGTDNVWTYAGVFKCNVPVVAVVNSALPAPYQDTNSSGQPIPSQGDIVGLVNKAYSESSVAGTPACCPSQITCGSTCCDAQTQICSFGICRSRIVHFP
jgi:hypothetical protein